MLADALRPMHKASFSAKSWEDTSLECLAMTKATPITFTKTARQLQSVMQLLSCTVVTPAYRKSLERHTNLPTRARRCFYSWIVLTVAALRHVTRDTAGLRQRYFTRTTPGLWTCCGLLFSKERACELKLQAEALFIEVLLFLDGAKFFCNTIQWYRQIE